ncbi:unnamed protein product [Dracunculus medinensis]|uniref:N(4)-(beta-N-acetylglucosaminyl)-L-asparaginase n=1 Tax=Dracunculus medinensis TaxID=318479 RepID=A0A0N4U937_DRAME|nr:unnamed protein product [Dracunculus medinensis]
MLLLCKFVLLLVGISYVNAEVWPTVVATWASDDFKAAVYSAYEKLISSNDRIKALIEGLSSCERLQCDGTVGYGGSPDEAGIVRLDALIFDGVGHKVGAVGSLANIRDAARVAHAVMKYTKHTLLVGDDATKFAIEMGFKQQTLSTNHSNELFTGWKERKCQPNFRMNVVPDARTNCGPYHPRDFTNCLENNFSVRYFLLLFFSFCEDVGFHGDKSHDTIGMIVLDRNGDFAAGTSTNGAIHKIPGRIGDSPIPGAGAYVDNEIGAAVGTGNGDILMRFAPTYQAVESMRSGFSSQKSAEIVIHRIALAYPDFFGAIVAVSKTGEYGAACHGMDSFDYSFRNKHSNKVKVITVKCI